MFEEPDSKVIYEEHHSHYETSISIAVMAGSYICLNSPARLLNHYVIHAYVIDENHDDILHDALTVYPILGYSDAKIQRIAIQAYDELMEKYCSTYGITEGRK